MNYLYKFSRLETLFSTAICCAFVLSYFLSFEIGYVFNLRVRLEELAAVLVLMQLFYLAFTKNLINMIPRLVLVPFSIIYIYSLFITFLGLIFVSWTISGLIFLFRDIQYFAVGLLFFFVLSTLNCDSTKRLNLIDKTILFSVSLNIAWIFYQLLSGDYRGHYAIAAIGLDDSSAASGISYYAGLVLSTFLYVKTDKKFILFMVILSFAGVLFTANRTFTVASVLFFSIWFITYYAHSIARVIRKGLLGRSALIVTVLMLSGVIGLFMLPQSVMNDLKLFEAITARNGVVDRLSRIEDGAEKRFAVVAMEIEGVSNDALSFYLGKGKGQYESQHGELKMGMHSQFSRLLNEVGLIGILMWSGFFCLLVFTFSRKGFLPPRLSRIAIAFVISFYSSFFSYDVLLISKSAFLFWISIFLMLSYSRNKMIVVKQVSDTKVKRVQDNMVIV